MAFKQAKKSGFDTTTWDKDSQKVITGLYTEHKTSVGGKPGSDLYVIENEEGKWAVWSSKVLDDYFSTIETGSLVKITFLGKKKSKNGVNTFNDYTVEVDDGTDAEMPF